MYNADIDVYEDRVRLDNSASKESHKILMISHKYEYDTLRIIIKEKDNFDSVVDYLACKTQEIGKTTMDPINQTNRNPFGKVLIKLRDIKKLVTQRDLVVDIQFQPYKIRSKTIIESKSIDDRQKTVNFDQSIYIPIHNRFNLIKIIIKRFSKEGLLLANKREAVVKTHIIPLPLIRENFKSRRVIQIPLECETLVKLNVIDKKEAEKRKYKNFDFEVLVEDFSDIRTKLLPFPNSDVNEENVKKQYYNLKDLRLILLRLKLIVMFLQKLIALKHFLNFKYPRLSGVIM